MASEMPPPPPARVWALGLGALVLLSGLLASAGTARAGLSKPAYGAGDRWVYELQGSLGALPGLNASQGGTFELGLTGLVEVDVTGADSAGVRAETHASGFLNGTFPLGNASILASGTFTSDSVELWENQDFLPVASNMSSVYTIDVKAFITIQTVLDLWLNATTAYASLPAFDVGVGDSASTAFTSDLELATTFSAFGYGGHTSNQTVVNGTWRRSVLGLENVTVDAGTFPAYRLNQTLGGFPGLASLPATGANETAWFSNDVGNYVRRVAYVNGTPVAEMRLKSYTYPVAPPGLTLLEISLLAAVAIAAALVIVVLLLRRRKAKQERAKGSSGAGPVGELPPKEPGGKP